MVSFSEFIESLQITFLSFYRSFIINSSFYRSFIRVFPSFTAVLYAEQSFYRSFIRVFPSFTAVLYVEQSFYRSFILQITAVSYYKLPQFHTFSPLIYPPSFVFLYKNKKNNNARAREASGASRKFFKIPKTSFSATLIRIFPRNLRFQLRIYQSWENIIQSNLQVAMLHYWLSYQLIYR